MTDIEIAQGAKMLPITEIAHSAGIDEKYIEQYGKYKAKIDLSLLKENKNADGIDFTIEKSTTEGIVINTNVTLSQADRIIIDVYNKEGSQIAFSHEKDNTAAPQYVLTPAKDKVYLHTGNGEPPKLISETAIPENQFVSGEKYRVCIVVYRWQKYVTIQ